MRSPASARVALALALSALAGLVLAALVLPVVGGAGLVARAGAHDFLDLPATLTTAALPQRSRILDRDGRQIATLFLENRVPVRLEDVPKSAQQALIAIEDNRFYAHNGVDLKGTIRALARNSSSGSVQQGGSTLTQQYVKNMLIEAARGQQAEQQAARARSVRRKLQEARYALELERTHTKAQILEGYLNIAYYGNGVYGIGTAANHYFGVPVQRLTLPQGALLAGMVQNPSGYDPQLHPRTALDRRNTVLGRMLDLGMIRQAEHDAAVHAPLGLRVTAVSSGCEAPGVTAPFFCDYVRRYLEDGPAGAALGDSLAKRQELLLAGGLTIRTTLDSKVQRAAQQAVDQQVPATDPFHAVAAVDTVEPGTGAVRAMAVDRAFGSKGVTQTKVNYALGGSLGFHAGSTFKAFVLARALQLGIPLSTTLYAPQTYRSKVFTNCTPDGCGPYELSNAGDSEAGTFNVTKATWRSVNTFFIQLEERTGVAGPAALAESLGVHAVQNGVADRPLVRGGSFVLGSSGVSPLDMAAAYAAFAAHGRYCAPSPVASITRPDGSPVAVPPTTCTQALEPPVADTLTSVLRGVIDGPDPYRTGLHASIGRPAAGKTGTENDSKAAWFIGYTPQLATAVWLGKPTPTPMIGVTINGRYYGKGVFGGDIPAAIWQLTMSQALAGTPPLDFTAGSNAIAAGTTVPLPDVTGQPVDAAVQTLRDLGFAVSVGPAVDGSPVPAGAVASTSPRAGTPVVAGSAVVVRPSSGRGAPPASPTAAPAPAYSFGPFFPSPSSSPPPPAPSPSAAPSPTKKHGR